MADEKKAVIVIQTVYENKGELQAKKGMSDLTKKANEMGNATASATKEGENGFNLFAKAAAGVVARIAAFKSVFSFFTPSIAAFQDNVRSVNMLAAAYKNVGYTAAGAMEQAKAFASEMQSMTGIADEKFLDAQRTLANYKVVGTQAQEAIRAAYALSANQGMEFEAALMLIARAAVGSTSTLSRYGIVLDQNVKEGDKFEAVLKQINEQFGASSQATMGDAITKTNALKESWGDFKEQVGAGLSEAFVPLLGYLTDGVLLLQKLFTAGGNYFDAAFGWIQTLVSGGKTAFLGLAAVAVKSLNQIISVGSKLHLIPKGVAEAAQRADDCISQATKDAAHQTAVLNGMRRGITEIWPEEKKITEAQERQLKLNAEQVNGKRDLAQAAADVVAEEKKATEETEKRIEAIKRNAGVGARDTLSGWTTPEMENEQTRADSLSAGDMFSGQTAQFSGLQDIDFLEEQLAAQRDKKLEYLQAELGDTEEYEQAKNEVLAQFNTEQAKLEQQRAKQNQQTMGTIFSNLISLSSSSNKKLAAIGKAAGIAQATISTYQGAANALANVPYPLNFAAAASVVAAGLMQVANIAGVELANGGLVKAVTGGVPAVIGEGGSDEAVLPLDNSRAMRRIGGAIAAESDSAGLAGAITVNVNVTAGGGLTAFLNELTEATQNGVTEALRYANVAVKAGNEQSGYSV
ncbi:MAG: hypothetical protein ACI4Q7_03440 [Candidatus Avelusimicrobium sp.]